MSIAAYRCWLKRVHRYCKIPILPEEGVFQSKKSDFFFFFLSTQTIHGPLTHCLLFPYIVVLFCSVVDQVFYSQPRNSQRSASCAWQRSPGQAMMCLGMHLYIALGRPPWCPRVGQRRSFLHPAGSMIWHWKSSCGFLCMVYNQTAHTGWYFHML